MQLLFIGAKTFIKIAKKNITHPIYITPINFTIEKVVQDIPHQYQAYKDVFKKKITNMLLEHQPYDCTIEWQ